MTREGWTYKKLGDICNVLNGLWVGKKEPLINIAVIRNTNFSKDCKLKLDDVAYIDVEERQFLTRKLQIGDIIIEKSGGSDKQPVGRPILFDVSEGEFSFSNFTATLRICDDAILPRFLHTCLYAHYRNGETLKMQSKTTGLHNLDMKAYLRLPIPIPPLSEQQRIVSELDLLSSIIEKKKEQLKEYDQLAQSIFYDMFGDPIDNPKGWEVKKLGDCCETTSGGTPSKNHIEYYKDGKIPWLRSGEVSQGLIYKTEMFITEDGLKHSSAKMIPIDSVAIAMYGATVGQVGIIKSPMCTNQAVCSIFPNDIFRPIYLYYFLLSKKEDYLRIAIGGAQPNISQGVIKNTIIGIPPLTLQQSFAEKIEAIEKQKELIKQSIAETETLFNSRMDYYFN